MLSWSSPPRVELRRTGRLWVSWVRAAAVSAFLAIALVMGAGIALPQWSALIPLLSV